MKIFSVAAFLMLANGTLHAAEQPRFDGLEEFFRTGTKHYAQTSLKNAGARLPRLPRVEKDECRESREGYRCLFQAGTAVIMADGPARGGAVRSLAVVTDENTKPDDAIGVLGMVAASVEPAAAYEEWSRVQSTWSHISQLGTPGHVYLGGTIVYYAFGKNGALLTSFARPEGRTK